MQNNFYSHVTTCVIRHCFFSQTSSGTFSCYIRPSRHCLSRISRQQRLCLCRDVRGERPCGLWSAHACNDNTSHQKKCFVRKWSYKTLHIVPVYLLEQVVFLLLLHRASVLFEKCGYIKRSRARAPIIFFEERFEKHATTRKI